MTDNKDILERAISKAVKGGWNPFDKHSPIPILLQSWKPGGMVVMAVVFGEEETQWVRELEGIIFNHDFAKALWGGDDLIGWYKCRHCDLVNQFLPAYKYHLAQMVIADDPIKYLGDNL